MATENKKTKIAFIVGIFPAISETFVINQVADLMDKGIEVEIFSFNKGMKDNISERYYEYKMSEHTHYLKMPENWIARFLFVLPIIGKLLFFSPALLFRSLDYFKYGKEALSLKLLYWTAPFAQKNFDLVHCHFGKIANKYLKIRPIIKDNKPLVTSFYGQDVSALIKEKGNNYYDKLKKECSTYFVMSENMKERVIQKGFKSEQLHVLPISINVESYPYSKRTLEQGDSAKLISVGRFVEKKGFDDLLRALAIVKRKTKKKFHCSIIGGGPLEKEIKKLANDLKLNDVVNFLGYLPIEKVINLFTKAHVFLQPSKTAKDGDME